MTVTRLSRGSLRWLGARLHRGEEMLTDTVGGPARRRAILVLACVLGLDSADKGAIGALAPQLEAAFHIGNTQIGLLVTVSSLVAAAATLPIGVLADRRRRTVILVASIVVWGVAEAASGLSVSYLMLLLTRLALGAVTATAGPTVASLTGDLFSAGERSRIYGFVLTGELVGAGVGVLVAGGVASIIDWRAAFFALGLLSAAVAWGVHRYLPEPARGGQSRLLEGAEEIPSVEEVEAHPEAYQVDDESGGPAPRDDVIAEEVAKQGVEPAEEVVIHGDPTRMTVWEAVRWVLAVKTNVLLIVASSLGYFFFAGLRTFAVIFIRGHYRIGTGTATILEVVVGAGAIAGILLAGRFADHLIRAGRIDARLVVGAVGYIAASIIFVPGILSSSLAISLPLFIVAGAALAAPNPSVDAARLDVVPSRMWGRAEAIRTVVRTVLEAFAPLLFGLVSQVLAGRGARASFGAGVNSKTAHVSAATSQGLEYTFLIMLLPLAVSGILLLFGRRSYPTDVASAGASEAETKRTVASPAQGPG